MEPPTKIAVLTTSDISTINEPEPQRYLRLRDEVDEPNFKYGQRAETVNEYGPHLTRYWTTGVLEMALAMHFTVWVLSTRRELSPTDSWWTKLVPGDHTILNSSPLRERWTTRVLEHFVPRLTEKNREAFGHRLHNLVHDAPGTMATLPYYVWSIQLDIEWPLDDGGMPMTWPKGLATLEQEGRIVTGAFFEDQMQPTTDEIITECRQAIHARRARSEELRGRIRNGTCIDCGCASGECEC